MMIADYVQMLLVPAMAALAGYCALLSRRVRKLNDLEGGLGAAIAVMTIEVDRLESSIRAARTAARGEAEALELQLRKAKAATERLERLTALSAPLPRPLRRRREEKADA